MRLVDLSPRGQYFLFTLGDLCAYALAASNYLFLISFGGGYKDQNLRRVAQWCYGLLQVSVIFAGLRFRIFFLLLVCFVYFSCFLASEIGVFCDGCHHQVK